jgi:hypothetical protein
MNGPTHYFPIVRCAKCGKRVERLQRIHDAKTKRRFIRVWCHGERTDVDFVTEINGKHEVFGDAAK